MMLEINSQISETLLGLARKHLPTWDGTPVEPVRIVDLRTQGEEPYRNQTVTVAFVDPDDFQKKILGYLSIRRGKVSACWGYAGTEYVGVEWSSRRKATRVQQILEAAGMGGKSAMWPPVMRILREAGIFVV